LTCDHLLLDLDQGAASAACGEEDVGHEIALDVVLLADFETLEELEACGN